MEDKDLKPFGAEFLEPLTMEVRGGEASATDCCTTWIVSTDPDEVAHQGCAGNDSCVNS